MNHTYNNYATLQVALHPTQTHISTTFDSLVTTASPIKTNGVTTAIFLCFHTKHK